MKKLFILAILLAFISVAYADMTTPQNLLLLNTGGRMLYYALSDNPTHYSNTLCASVNNKTLKEEVKGIIRPGGSMTLTIKALNNYQDYCSMTSISYHFSFGLSQKAATYNMNGLFIMQNFNTSNTTSEPFTYQFSPWSKLDVFSGSFKNNDGAIQININSDSNYFKY